MACANREAHFHRHVDRRARPQFLSVVVVADDIGLAQAIAEGLDDERFDVELRHDVEWDGDGIVSPRLRSPGRT
jgi:hypothetical protein